MRVWLLLFCSVIALNAESAAGIKWTVPSGWKAEAARPMRAATYSIAPDGECAVNFFGAGQGGGVDANVERWKGQFHAPGGKPADTQVKKRTVHGLAVTTIDVSGEYSGMGGPMAPGKPVAGYRLLGAIVEGPGGSVFIKFTGPVKTVTADQQKFEQLLGSLDKDRS
jgi:hypothetical protein